RRNHPARPGDSGPWASPHTSVRCPCGSAHGRTRLGIAADDPGRADRSMAIQGLRRGLARLLSFGWARSRVSRTVAWEAHFHAGMIACREGRWEAAIGQYAAALREAEWFEDDDPRLTASLSALAALYRHQGRPADAEPLCRRGLALKERALGPLHPDVAASLADLAA